MSFSFARHRSSNSSGYTRLPFRSFGIQTSHWIVTVKFSNDVGEPPLPVPVRTLVVAPEGLVGLVGLVELELLPPPHATMMVATEKAISIAAARHHIFLFCAFFNRNISDKPRILNAARAAIHPVVPHGRTKGMIPLAVVVFTVTITGTLVVLAVKTTLVGLKLHVAAVGRFEHDRVTVPVYPATAVAVTLMVPEAPALDMVTAGLEDER
jgi:hypothetical protein